MEFTAGHPTRKNSIRAFAGRIRARVRESIRKNTMRRMKADPKKVMFMTYNNRFICNPRYIAEELIRRQAGIELVWAVSRDCADEKYPPEIKQVLRGSPEFFREMATAKVWVDNALNFLWEPAYKKEGQYLIETWHGSMGFKRFDNTENPHWASVAAQYAAATDYCLSNSGFEDEVFRSTHWPDTQIIPTGHARNDILFTPKNSPRYTEAYDRFLSFYRQQGVKIGTDDRFLLYAPTWRDNGRTDCFDVDFARVIRALEERFGGRWHVLYRLHHHDKENASSAAAFSAGMVIPATDYPDMQELMLIADAGLTDYSSWLCDYVLTGKPGFIFATDLDRYNTERGLYYKLETTPFPIAAGNDLLCENILSFDAAAYAAKCAGFLEEKRCYENGTAAKQAADLILKLLTQ